MQMIIYGHQETTVNPCPPITDDCCGDLYVCPNMDGTCDMQSTCCPSGCCPEPNWFCCPDYYCAATPVDCAFASKRHELLSWVRGPWAGVQSKYSRFNRPQRGTC